MRKAASSSSGGRTTRSSVYRNNSAKLQPVVSEAAVPQEHDSNQTGCNIRVIARCRGRNSREVNAKSPVVVDTSLSKSQISVRTDEELGSSKIFSLDRVYGPEADQSLIFDEVVVPIVEDFISGMNCTVFAYGQTGAGKTFTMSGDDQLVKNTYTENAGIIPRVLFHVFNSLDLSGTDCMVSCSFLELYNEELRDLLNDDETRKVRIFDDQNKKCVSLSGHSEMNISSAISGLKILQQGLNKRHVAATKMNDVSSRSHSIFTLSVTTSPQSEFAIKSKLHLVDLAGSENIGKSGAENRRAREAGMINQSLLSLGRVINSLVDKSPHIPYRESKLTRLLQDSLGGHTKTCIIATVSPALVNLEETLSTLEYATRAKSIKTKPQINALANMKNTLKECSIEMEKLQSDLVATRKKNGIYLDEDNYKELMAETRSQQILAKDQKRKLDTMELQLKKAREGQDELRSQLLEKTKLLQESRNTLTETEMSLRDTQQNLELARKTLKHETALRKAHAGTEWELQSIGEELIKSLDLAMSDIDILQEKLQKTNAYDTEVEKIVKTSADTLKLRALSIENEIRQFDAHHMHLGNELTDKVNSLLGNERQRLEDASNLLQDGLRNVEVLVDSLLGNLKTSQSGYDEFLSAESTKLRSLLVQLLSEGLQSIKDSASGMLSNLQKQISQVHSENGLKLSETFNSFEIFQSQCKQYVKIQLKELENQKSMITQLMESLKKQEETKAELLKKMLDQHGQASETRRQKFAQTIEVLVQNFVNEERNQAKITAAKTNETMRQTKHNTEEHNLLKACDEKMAKSGEFLLSMHDKAEALEQQLDPTKSSLLDISRIKAAAESFTSLGQHIESHLVSAKNNAGELDEFVRAAKGHNESAHRLLTKNAKDLSNKIQHSFDCLNKHLENLHSKNNDVEMSSITSKVDKQWKESREKSLTDVHDIKTILELLIKDLTEKKELLKKTGNTPEKRKVQFSRTLPQTGPNVAVSPIKSPTKSPVKRQGLPLNEINNHLEISKAQVSRSQAIPLKRPNSNTILPTAQRRHVG